MTDHAEADGSNRWPKERASGSVEHQGSENHRKVRPNTNNECGDSNHAGGERCQSPLRADHVKQFATRRQSKQVGETARGEDEADVLLRPFLLGQINGYIGTEASQHGRIEKIEFSSIGQRYNECHLLNVLSHRKPGRPHCIGGESLIVCRVRQYPPRSSHAVISLSTLAARRARKSSGEFQGTDRIRSSIPVADNLDLFLSLLSDGAVWAAEANAPTTRRVSGRSHSSARPQAAMVARLENARLRPKWSIAYPPKVVLNAAPIPTALPTIPSPRLNRPVPRVMSATTRVRTTPRTAALTPSRA